MQVPQIAPTPYADVNALIRTLLKSVQPILGEQLIGMYIFGSLALGDFDEDSDIDVAVITESEISDDRFAALRAMHEHIGEGDSPWAIQLEVSYLSKRALAHYQPANATHPQLQRGKGEKLVMENHARVIERHVLRERGIRVVGPPLKGLIDPISPADLRYAMTEILHEWLEPMLGKSAPFESRGYQSYTVLSLCRMLYTLEHGTVVSKPVAARWAQEKLGARFSPLIENARVGRQNPELPPLRGDVNETLHLMRYALELSSARVSEPER